MKIEGRDHRAKEFFELLLDATKMRNCAWIQGDSHGVVFCFVDGDRIGFYAYDCEGDLVDLSADVCPYLIRAQYRHINFDFSQSLGIFSQLVEFLRAAPYDSEVLHRLNVQVETRAYGDLRRSGSANRDLSG